MHPFTVVLGIVTGSLVSLAFGLGVTLFVFWALQHEHPRFAAELPEVARGFLIFLWLALNSSLAFLGTLQLRRWRFGVLALLWLGLLGTAWYYWP